MNEQVAEVTEEVTETPVEEVSAETAESLSSEPGQDESKQDDATSTDDVQSSGEQGSSNQGAADNKKKIVRVLSVGQEVQGTVKRVTDFGAFVDIGVGRDGLIHISELSITRVGKVSDVLSKDQEITTWIKELDRERNRISLTMIAPGTKTIRDLEKGDMVQGEVTRIEPYGAFVDIGVGRDALLHIREMSDGYIKTPDEVVKSGDEIEARIIDISRRRQRIDLSLKGLRPEPEPEPEFEPEFEEEDDMADDDFEEVEVLSAMELAFKKAMGDSGGDGGRKKGKRGRRNKRDKRHRSRSVQDEIIARTLGDN